MEAEVKGYNHDRFPNFQGDVYDCGICHLVARDPRECAGCGSLLCAACVEVQLRTKKQCPNGCAANQIGKISKALYKLYAELDIKCKNFAECNSTLKVCDLDKHEAGCNAPKCVNFDICANRCHPALLEQKVCDPSCILLTQFRSINMTNLKDVREKIDTFLTKEVPDLVKSKKFAPPQALVAAGQPSPSLGFVFHWDPAAMGQGIELSEENMKAYLKESSYMFRTIVADKPFTGGIHYWEILADSRTENELKIGVACKKDFNYNSAFCDYDFGYAYYGLGQVRHGSNASGPQYGAKFKKEGVLGILLDMTKGTLSFALNGKTMGVAFQAEQLKTGPIWPAVALLHHAGFSLRAGKPVPEGVFV